MENYIGDVIIICFLGVIILIIVNYLKTCREPFQNNQKKTIQDFKNEANLIKEQIKELKKTRNELKVLSNEKSSNKNYNYRLIEEVEKKLDQKISDEVQNMEDNGLTEKISNLNKELVEIMNELNKLEKTDDEIKYITSLENGMKLAITKIKSFLDSDIYTVNLNNKCLSVDSIGNYDLKPCNKNDKKQYFKLKTSLNNVDYISNLQKGISHNLNKLGDVQYPVSHLISNNNGNCVQNNSDHISIQPCAIKQSQQWKLVNSQNSKDMCGNNYSCS